MKRIWKYPMDLNSYKDGSYEVSLAMQVGARVLYMGSDQSGVPCLWAEVDEDAQLETRTFVSVGTGHGVVPDGLAYVGSTVLPSAEGWSGTR